MSEAYKKVNDYTLRVTEDLSVDDMDTSNYYSAYKQRAQLTRIFNFRAAQVTTLFQQNSYVIGKTSETGGGAANNAQMTVQNFDDVQSRLEIEFMHAQLKKLGGKPPALEEITGNIGKKKSLSAPRNG